MLNDVWLKFAQFLGTLNGENVKRESYVRTPEYEAALEAWKKTEQEWEAFLETLPVGEQEKAEEMKERLEDFASAQEKRAYIQGYADCIQVLFHMELLKENEDLANFVIGCSFILPASTIYYFKKSKKSAIAGCIIGTFILTLFGTAFNAVYLLPAFSKLYGMPLDSILAMGSAVNPLMTDGSIISFVACCVAPMNLIKGGSVSLVTMLIYKPLSPIIKAGK